MCWQRLDAIGEENRKVPVDQRLPPKGTFRDWNGAYGSVGAAGNAL